jgi:hypothetical protein
MEFFIAIATAIGVAVGVWIYKRWFHAEAARHPGFEAWCRSQPLLLALHRPGGALDLAHVVRHALAPHGEYVNRNGTYPWQHYFVSVEVRRLDADVLGLVVTACRLRRETESRPDLEALVAALGEMPGAAETEVWLHGQLHASERPTGFDRNRVAWAGRVGGQGAVELREMIGAPPWLVAHHASAA